MHSDLMLTKAELPPKSFVLMFVVIKVQYTQTWVTADTLMGFAVRFFSAARFGCMFHSSTAATFQLVSPFHSVI